MKLVLCRDCSDVIKLDYERRYCKCGHSGGNYKEDGIHAVVVGDAAVALGLDNKSMAQAFHNGERLEDGHDNDWHLMQTMNFKAWVFHRKNPGNIEYRR